MVENPASSVGSDMANRAIDAEVSADRVEELARQGMRDPSALKPDDVRDICAAFIGRIDKAQAA